MTVIIIIIFAFSEVCNMHLILLMIVEILLRQKAAF